MRKGFKFSQESKEKMRYSHLGKKHTEEQKQKIRLSNLGKKHKPMSIEGRRNISLAHIGKTKSEKWKQSMSKKMQGHPFWGKRFHSEEEKIRISLSLKGKPLSKEHRRNISLGRMGIIFSDTTKQKMRLAKLGKTSSRKGKKLSEIYKNPEEFRKKISEAHLGHLQTEETKRKISQYRLNQVFPKKDTSIEVRLQNKLRKLNIIFTTHKSLLNLTQCDIFIEPNIVIYTDGCWWHGCEKCFTINQFTDSDMGRKILKKKAIDILITTKLVESGYKVLRFWEHDINNNFEDKVLDEIVFTINENKEVKI